MISTDLIARANATSRHGGAVGSKALVPRYVESVAKDTDFILDYGAGKRAAHAARLRESGLNVVAHEFGANFNGSYHDRLALMYQYDIVYASNVLNVQGHGNMLWETLGEIYFAVKSGGRAIFNYPESPRLLPLNAEGMKNIIEAVFHKEVKQVGGTKRAPVWEVFR